EIGHGGLVYECAGQVLAYVTVQEGKCGLYIQSVIHPDVYDQSRLIIGSALAHVKNADRLPAYFAVRRYQEWLPGPLADCGFDPWSSQAVMVKHTVARVEHPVFKPVHALEGVINARTHVIDCWNWNPYSAPDEPPTKELVDGISHNRRSGKAQSSPPS